MSALWVLVSKEIRDNLRDRRSLFFALLYGPVLMPLLMIGPLLFSINQNTIDVGTPRDLAVVGQEQAPNLIQFLHRHNFDAVSPPENFHAQVESGQLDVVLEIPVEYPERFSAGRPAELIIHYNSGEDDSVNGRRHLNSVLEAYADQVRSLRFQVRGIDSQVFEPVEIRTEDVAEQPGELAFFAYMVPFLLMFSMLMGGYYLAVDTTAGERERQSLEPLLSLPLGRSQLVLGKYLAILAFVILAMVLPLLSAFVLFRFLPKDAFDNLLHFGPGTFGIALLSNLSTAFLVSAFLMSIAAYTRNTKEAQTHLSFAMLLPMVPFFALQYLSVPRETWTMLIPILSQFQIMELAVQGSRVPVVFVLLSTLSSLGLAGVLMGLAIRLYHRERILQ